MSEEKLFKNLMSLMTGIDACLEQKLVGPALILIYSTIDTAGWLDTDQPFATRQGFITWVEKYLLPAKPLALTQSIFTLRVAVCSTPLRRTRK